MTQIADYVMSTGLGLDSGRSLSPASPTSVKFMDVTTTRPKGPRRSLSGSISAASAAQPNLTPGQPLMSSKDIHVIFANLEEIASLAEAFAGMLEEAAGSEEQGAQDRIGATFLEMVSTHCFFLRCFVLRHSFPPFSFRIASSHSKGLLELLRPTPPSHRSSSGA